MSHLLQGIPWATDLVLGVLSLAGLTLFVRLVKGPSLPDRVVAFDLLTVLVVGVLATASIAYDTPLLLDAAMVLALVSFLATAALANFIIRRGGDPP